VAVVLTLTVHGRDVPYPWRVSGPPCVASVSHRCRDGQRSSPAQRLEPVTLGEPLRTLTTDRHTAEARVRVIDGIGLELRR